MLAGASAAGLLMVYLMVFKKWRLSDFLYVTRRSLKQGLEQVNKGGHVACWCRVHHGSTYCTSQSWQVGSTAYLV